MINGIKFTNIKFGIYDNVRTIGRKGLALVFLKNSISSNKLRIKPKQIEIKIALKTILLNRAIK